MLIGDYEENKNDIKVNKDAGKSDFLASIEIVIIQKVLIFY